MQDQEVGMLIGWLGLGAGGGGKKGGVLHWDIIITPVHLLLPICLTGSTAKPEELYHIVEHFALGQRRLELFGEDHNIRAGWITVGKNLTSSNFNAQVNIFLVKLVEACIRWRCVSVLIAHCIFVWQTYCKYVGDADGKVWQGGRGNPPLDAPHLVGTTPEIEALRPKSPPPRAQQQQQSQAANSASQPSAAHSNSKKAPNTSQGMSPQNAQGSSAGPGQVANSSSVIVITTSSPSQGQRGGNTKQMRRSPLHLEAGQGITEDEKAMGHDTAHDPATANEELKPSKDMAS